MAVVLHSLGWHRKTSFYNVDMVLAIVCASLSPSKVSMYAHRGHNVYFRYWNGVIVKGIDFPNFVLRSGIDFPNLSITNGYVLR